MVAVAGLRAVSPPAHLSSIFSNHCPPHSPKGLLLPPLAPCLSSSSSSFLTVLKPWWAQVANRSCSDAASSETPYCLEVGASRGRRLMPPTGSAAQACGSGAVPGAVSVAMTQYHRPGLCKWQKLVRFQVLGLVRQRGSYAHHNVVGGPNERTRNWENGHIHFLDEELSPRKTKPHPSWCSALGPHLPCGILYEYQF